MEAGSGGREFLSLSSDLPCALSQVFRPAEDHVVIPGVLREGGSPESGHVSPCIPILTWIPAGSELTTESSTHSKQALVCPGLYHLFRLSLSWCVASSFFTARRSEAAVVNWSSEVCPFRQQGDSTLLVSSALSVPCCLLPPHPT